MLVMQQRFVAVLSGLLVAAAGAPLPSQSFTRIRENRQRWKKPCLVRWQRSVDDAIAVARARGVPVLIAVNIDEEVASMRFALRKYRDPKFAELTRGYECVIVSPNRHVSRDHDEQGRRIVCPKFGTVTCGEHIDADLHAFEKFFGGRRVAPRHVAATPDGEVLFDRFLDNDLSKVDRALAEHRPENPSALPEPADLAALLRSRDARHREELERRYAAGDRGVRARILRGILEAGAEQTGVLWMGISESDAGLRGLATKALAGTATRTARRLLVHVLDFGDGDHDALLAALARIGADDFLARRAHTVRVALATDGRVCKATALLAALREEGRSWPADTLSDEDLATIDRRLDELGARRKQGDPQGATSLEIAELNLRYALDRMRRGKDPTFLLADAEQAAKRAGAAGAPAWRVAAIRARAAHLLGRAEEAAKLAEQALPGLVEIVGSPLAAAVLEIWARTWTEKVYVPLEKPKDDYPAAAVSEAHAAWSVLDVHPFGTEKHVLSHLDMLGYLGAQGAARKVLEAAIRRYPTSPAIHERYRDHLLTTGGPPALERAYRELPASRGAEAAALWFQGYAFLIAAEQRVRDFEAEAALADYRRSVEYFAAAVRANPGYASSANHYAVLALGGRARLLAEAGRDEAAVEALVRAAGLWPQSFPAKDGLGSSALETAKALAGKLGEGALRSQLVARLREAGITLE